MSVLTVSYPGGRTRQFSLRGEIVANASLGSRFAAAAVSLSSFTSR
jgi:hypothetical protein